MTSRASLTGAMSRRVLFPLLSLLLLFGAVSGAALTCLDDTSVEDNVIEVEAVIDGNANPSLLLSAVHSQSSSAWQGQHSRQMRAAGATPSTMLSALQASPPAVLRV